LQEIPLAEKGKRGVTVFAIEDAILFYLNADNFEKTERSYPEIALKVLKRLLTVASLGLRSGSDRLTHFL